MSTTRHLLDLDDADRPFIEALIARARQFKAGVPNESTRLRGRIIMGMFFEPSTRTTTRFSVAAQRLGANWIDFRTDSSSLAKGESLEDTMRTIRAIGADAVVVRHAEAGFPHLLARYFEGSVYNAGDGAHAHPTQGLLDAMTLVEEFGDLRGRRLVIAGDIRHSRVARSARRRRRRSGRPWSCAARPRSSRRRRQAGALRAGHRSRPRLASRRCRDAPTDPNGARRGRPAAFGRSRAGLRPHAARAKALPPHAIIMHPGPVNRGLEMRGARAHPRSRIERQVENGVYMRMACLERNLGAQPRERVA